MTAITGAAIIALNGDRIALGASRNAYRTPTPYTTVAIHDHRSNR